MPPKAMKYGAAKPLPANAFRNPGHKFVGWNTAPDGSGTKYANKAKVKNLTAEDGGTVTLYAIWG